MAAAEGQMNQLKALSFITRLHNTGHRTILLSKQDLASELMQMGIFKPTSGRVVLCFCKDFFLNIFVEHFLSVFIFMAG